MKIRFKKITERNKEQVKELRVFDSQKGYIETVSECLAEAAENEAWQPRAIYDEAQLVGFTMYGLLTDGRVWLDRLLIDKGFQGRGYGKASVQELLKKLLADYQVSEVFLSVYEENQMAVSLYQRLGFSFNGERDTKGEKVMRYKKAE